MRRIWLMAVVTVAMASIAPAASAAGWTIVTAPAPAPATSDGNLTAISCVSATDCMAVGQGAGQSPLAERWNGTSWTVQALPGVTGGDLLNAVSCSSDSSCMAVGDLIGVTGPFAEQWNGSTWSYIPAPSAGNDAAKLMGVSCVSSSACIAVGNDGVIDNGDGQPVDQHALAETWNGTAWSIATAAAPAGALDTSFAAVSCAAANACTAVGSEQTATATTALAQRWNGTAWSVQTTAGGAGGTGLTGVSCASPTACAAVGADAGGALTEGWDGQEWSLQDTPREAGTLYAVACSSATACTAVGADGGSSLAEVFNGTSWSMQTAPGGSDLAGVSCGAGQASCIAVGATRVPGIANGAAFAAREGPARWASLTIPNASVPADGTLQSVSCPSPAFCAAVGGGGSEIFSGGRWSPVPVALDPGALEVGLAGVSCTSSTSCMAVGEQCIFPCLVDVAVAERFNGSSWTIEPTPGGEGTSALTGVSCTADGACTAVGGYAYQVGVMPPVRGPITATWNGSAWSALPAPASGPLAAVSCISAVDCTAVGGSGSVRWNGAMWAAHTGSDPTGALHGVSCAIPTICAAVGADTAAGSTLAEGWDGVGWTTQPTPNRVGADTLNGVSCASATRCTAVGAGDGTLVQVWDGTSWTTQLSPNPGDATAGSAELNGASCTAGTACVAVGGYIDAAGAALPLIETFLGPAANVTVSLSPASITADGASHTTAVATVTDADLDAVAGDHVSFSSSDPGDTIGPVTDDGNGTYTTTITSSTAAGEATITATDSSVAPSVSGRATLTQTAPPAAPVITTTGTGSGASGSGAGGAGGASGAGASGGSGTTSKPPATKQKAKKKVVRAHASIGKAYVRGTTTIVPIRCLGDVGRCWVRVTVLVRETLVGGTLVAVAASGQQITHRLTVVGSAVVELAVGGHRVVSVPLNAVGRHLLVVYRHLKLFLHFATSTPTSTSRATRQPPSRGVLAGLRL